MPLLTEYYNQVRSGHVWAEYLSFHVPKFQQPTSPQHRTMFTIEQCLRLSIIDLLNSQIRTIAAQNVCSSNSDVKAGCGKGALVPGTECPLNVYCGPFGYCGVTGDFCEPGCQSNCPQPGPTKLNTGTIQNLVIGFVLKFQITRRKGNWCFCRHRAAWSLTRRGCMFTLQLILGLL